MSRDISVYLDMLPREPEIKFLTSNSLALTELKRVEQNLPAHSLDLARYTKIVEAPSSLDASQNDWKQRLQDLSLQVECASQSVVNAQLASTYGASSWKEANAHVESSLKRAKEISGGMRAEITKLNKRRKFAQIKAGQKIAALKEELHTLENETARTLKCVAVEKEGGS